MKRNVCVSVPPMIWIPNQLIGASIGSEVTLDCNTEAFPLSLNYWTKDDNYMIVSSDKFKTSNSEKSYKVQMKLTIKNIESSDFGINSVHFDLLRKYILFSYKRYLSLLC